MNPDEHQDKFRPTNCWELEKVKNWSTYFHTFLSEGSDISINLYCTEQKKDFIAVGRRSTILVVAKANFPEFLKNTKFPVWRRNAFLV